MRASIDDLLDEAQTALAGGAWDRLRDLAWESS